MMASPIALAQDATRFVPPQADPEPAPPPASLESVPDEYIDEAMGYYDFCMGRTVMNQYYDCKCLSMKFLDTRIARGPVATKEEIGLSLLKECRDATSAAGPAYQECLNTANMMKEGTDPEAMCSCVGNTYAKMISRDAPNINSRTIVRYKSMARLACETPITARKLGINAQ